MKHVKLYNQWTTDLGVRLITPVQNFINRKIINWLTYKGPIVSRKRFNRQTDEVLKLSHWCQHLERERKSLHKEIKSLAPKVNLAGGFYDFRFGNTPDHVRMVRNLRLELRPIQVHRSISMMGYEDLPECTYAIEVMKEDLARRMKDEISRMVDKALEDYKR